MQGDPRLRGSGGVAHRAQSFVAKTAAIVLGGVMLAGAFVVSLAFFVFALAVVLVGGGYLWWKTRGLRRQLREQMHGRETVSTTGSDNRASPSGNVIEGVVVAKSETRD